MLFKVSSGDFSIIITPIFLFPVLNIGAFLIVWYLGCGGEEIPAEAWLLGVSLFGIPGGLLGALIGSQTGGDEIIFI